MTAPVASIAQAEETNSPEGLDEIVHGPTSCGANRGSPDATRIESPAIPAGAERAMTGGASRMKPAKSAVSTVTVSVTLMSYGVSPGFADAETAKAAVTVPTESIEQLVPGVLANNGPVGELRVQLRALPVLNPPPETRTSPDPSAGRVPNPGETTKGDTTIVGVLTTVIPVAVWSTPGCPVTVTTCAPEMTPTTNDVPEANWPRVFNEHVYDAPPFAISPAGPVIVQLVSAAWKPDPETWTVCPVTATRVESEMIGKTSKFTWGEVSRFVVTQTW
jgi:hypothetical protein